MNEELIKAILKLMNSLNNILDKLMTEKICRDKERLTFKESRSILATEREMASLMDALKKMKENRDE